MIRYIWVNGKRAVAPLAPIPVAYTEALHALTAAIGDLYMEAFAAPREDNGSNRLRGNRFAIVDILRKTDRVRGLSEHNISILTDRLLEALDFHTVIDTTAAAIIRDANTGFERLIQSSAKGRKLKTALQVIDIRARHETSRFVPLFRRNNTGLIRALVSKQVEATENVLAKHYGKHVVELSAEIQATTGATKSHANLLARDQTLKLNSDIQQFRSQSVGATKYTWITSNDERVRGRPGGKWADSDSNHWKLHGLVFEYNSPPVTNSKKGIRLNPGRDFQCRCTASPNLDHIFA